MRGLLTNEFFWFFVLIGLLLILILLGARELPGPLELFRVVLGLPFVLFMPGYALQVALFPRTDRGSAGLDGPERAALSFGLSVALIPVVALLLSSLPWGIHLRSVTAAWVTLVAGLGAAAEARRARMPVQARFAPLQQARLRPILEENRPDHPRVSILVPAGLLLAVASIVAIALWPKPGDSYSEFYILGTEGRAESYPREVVAGQPMTVTLGIANHRTNAGNYEVKVLDGDHELGTLKVGGLPPGNVVEEQMAISPRTVGDNTKITFELRSDGSSAPDRVLNLFLKVNPG
jgi:uncharacterized membrane protein